MLQNFNWFGMRWAALVLLSVMMVDVELLLINFGFIFFHMNMGLKTILMDYIHIEKVNLISLIATSICYIELIRYSMELFV